ncbi:TetR/AcrR family transcriptional regulator [Qaidamihabitans albus]|uniref:TetR/AcrR family transcriptional regulator n=1 Tax=Qaidamihabitans albus TaxID=2795733 RepID=UPI0018F1108C|nr:TetR/AcrR family transcriptional regulator [Qaidamihabitans albus]
MTAGPRERLVDSAITLIRERGVHATGLTDLLEHSRTARASIYQHFPGGKADLIAEATHAAGRQMDTFVAGVLESGAPLDAIDALLRWLRRTLRDTDFAVGCPVVAAALSGADTTAAREAAASAFRGWQRTLAAAFTREGLPEATAVSLAGFVVSGIEGALVQARAMRSVQPLDDARVQLAALLRGYLGETGSDDQ